MELHELHDKFPAAADYLSEMFLIERDYDRITNLRLSERLGVSKPAVTQSVKRLSKLGLVQQDRYGVIKLTPEGRVIAKAVLERHYLIEHVLVDMLDYPWEKSDKEAKELQVIISEELKDHINKKLGQPQTCPHGNPFPDTPVEKELLTAPRLIQTLVGSTVELVRITEEGEEVDGLLDFCFQHNLKPGTLLNVRSRNQEGLMLSKGRIAEEFLIPLSYARHLCYKELNRQR